MALIPRTRFTYPSISFNYVATKKWFTLDKFDSQVAKVDLETEVLITWYKTLIFPHYNNYSSCNEMFSWLKARNIIRKTILSVFLHNFIFKSDTQKSNYRNAVYNRVWKLSLCFSCPNERSSNELCRNVGISLSQLVPQVLCSGSFDDCWSSDRFWLANPRSSPPESSFFFLHDHYRWINHFSYRKLF